MKKRSLHGLGFHSFKFKIFAANLCIVLAGFLLFGGILMFSLLKSAVEENLALSRTAYENITEYTREKVDSLRHTLDTIALDPQVTSILSDSEISPGAEEWYRNYQMIQQICTTNIMLSEIREILIITDHPMASIYGSELIKDYSSFSASDWYAHSTGDLPTGFFLPAASLGESAAASPRQLIFTRPYLFHYYDQKMFFLGVLDQEILDQVLTAGSTSPYSSCFLVNQDGTVLSQTSSFELGELSARILSSWDGEQEPLEPQTFSHRKYYLGIAPIGGCDLALVYLLDYSRLARDLFWDNLRKMLLILVSLLPFVALSSYGITLSLTKRLDQLKNHMLKVSAGDFSMEALSPHTDDEIAVLNQHFNYMATKIALLLDEKVADGKRMKEIEFLALQAQINPHFLYNTLDLIKWKAIRHKDTEIEQLVCSLSDYYRLALGKGREFVPLQAELKHIEAYLYIQNKRFEDAILLDCQVPPQFLEYLLPRLTLQPIVENAILHGILEKPQPQGKITISARICDHFVLHITDDGVGMEPEVCEGLLQPAKPDQVMRSGYGLYNIHTRLQLIYGKEFGLQITSRPSEGTDVSLHLPLEPKRPQ